MVTTTTSPRAASTEPSYQGMEPEPLTNAPPWIHTMTGSGSLESFERRGVQTFNVRQSSDISAPMPRVVSSTVGACIAAGPVDPASRTPSHARTGSGGRNRSAPSGGAA
jgi:hypothetical protein